MSSKNVDRISSLPEEIVSHILSLMPTMYAVQTCILSKRWRYTWMFVTNLDFEKIPRTLKVKAQADSLTKAVDRVLKFCKTSQLQLFRLHFPLICVHKSNVSNWINEAVRLNVHELDLHVNQLELPLSMFTCKTLTKLRLHQRASYKQSSWECLFPVNLPCLKTLDLIVVAGPLVNAFKLISGCPVLESLYLKVSRYDNVEDYIFNIPTLKQLKLTLLCSSVVNKVVLDVPNLEYLFVGGKMCSSFVMKNVSSLVEASVSVYASVSFTNIGYDFPLAVLLKGLSGVKSLSVQYVSSIVLVRLPIFPNMKHLELKSGWHAELILQFFEKSPELKHLCIEKLAGSCWIEPKLVPACMLTNLTTITFSIYRTFKFVILFLKYTLGNAEVLKKVTVIWENSSVEEKSQFCAELLKLPRASRSVSFVF